jgi:hypothetical protein
MITDEQYIESLEEMIATTGWSLLVEEAKQTIYQLQADALEATSWDIVQRKKGQAAQLAELVNLEEMLTHQRNELSQGEDVMENIEDAII